MTDQLDAAVRERRAFSADVDVGDQEVIMRLVQQSQGFRTGLGDVGAMTDFSEGFRYRDRSLGLILYDQNVSHQPKDLDVSRTCARR